jgi:hypothetical protein
MVFVICAGSFICVLKFIGAEEMMLRVSLQFLSLKLNKLVCFFDDSV